MAPPISPGDEAKDWLDRAVADLKMARLAFSADPPLVREGLYHCQQAAEKALKGFLALHDHPFRRTHDSRELGESCESFDAPLREILEPA
jgi:HEPN domain-containing protein